MRVAMRLARQRGSGDYQAVLAELDADDVARLLAFEALEPWGSVREDRRIARLITHIVASIPFRGKDATVPKEEEIFPDTLRRDPRLDFMTAGELKATMIARADAANG
jgi:hypothetical protein